jgi:aminopeptidase N
MPRRVAGALLAVAVAASVILGPASSAGADFVKGAPGAGDPFFPRAGNGGYDVRHYRLRLRYAPGTNRLRADARIRAVATESLARFDLDYRGPRIRSLRIGHRRARFRRHGQELIVHPRHGIRDGRAFTVRVRYRGKPRPVIDPDGSEDGWIPTDDGAFVAGEPQGAPTWFPCDDYPTDKARYDFRVTVPRGTVAVANGRLRRRIADRRHTTFVWHEGAPMATYLATVTTGRFRTRSAHAAGVPSYIAVDPTEGSPTGHVVGQIGPILKLFHTKFGPYPFNQTGAIVDHAPGVGYSLETQTRPLFPGAPGEITMAHELAHQWFGDDVTPARWRDIWLNEGFATWAQWRWGQHLGGPTTKQRFDTLYAAHGAGDSAFWNPPPGDPGGPQNLFAGSIYERGAMTLEALRERIGDATFYEVLRDWIKAHRFGNAKVQDFVALAEADSGQDLSGLFDAWLFTPGKPTSW